MPYLLIFFGCSIYIFLRPGRFIFSSCIDNIYFLQNIRGITVPYNIYLPNWFLYSLPDGLWLFSFCLIITKIWKKENNYSLWFWSLTLPITSIIWEIGQSVNLIKGTFDFIDLLIYSIITFLTIMNNKKKNYEKII